MKKSLIIALLLIPFFGFSQTKKPIDGFLGIKFGSTQLAVITAVKAKGGHLDKAYSNAKTLMFTNVKMGDRESKAFRITFVNGKAFEAEYIFAADDEAKIPEFYQDLADDLTGIYGTGEVTKNYTSPYAEGENAGDDLLGLSVDKIDFHTMWTDDKNNNSIVAYINSDMTVHLLYDDDALSKIYNNKEKAKNSSDY